MIFRTYITESMRLAPQGKYIGVKYRDIVRPKEQESAEEIVTEVVETAGLVIT